MDNTENTDIEPEEDNEENMMDRPSCGVAVRYAHKYNTDRLFLGPASKKSIAMFHSTACGHCEETLPHFRRASMHLCGRVQCVSVDVDLNEDLAEKLNITALPTFIVFENGHTLRRSEGAASTFEIVNFASR